MSLLLESIKLSDGEFYNLSYHEQRMNRSLKILCGVNEHFNLEDFFGKMSRPLQGLHKCRILYDENSMDVEFVPYAPKMVETLKAVEDDKISYPFKYANRLALDKLFAQRGTCDDVLIIKRGVVTDSSYANLIFRKGKNWYTPWSPLLKGTMRAYLLERNIIQEDEILLDEVKSFEAFKLINAMLAFDSPEVNISNIIF